MLCHGTVCVVGKIRDLILQLSKSSIYSTKPFFARTLCDIDYAHMPDLAPTREMFERYKLQKGDWDIYSSDFIDLITKRHIETLEKSQFADACLLCSEHKPHHCHRRLVAEYLADKWPDVTIMHL
ncbi:MULTISPECIES: DUF488 domain-containing protein [Klebsiella pneumoniae complex]|nr:MULTISPECIES: DUF488 domain-containing protein [Klebsiella]